MLAVVVTMFSAATIVWSTLRVGISPMPSSEKARDAIFELMKDSGGGTVYDLGSGWGSLVIPLARQYPNRRIVGYEISFVPWLVSVLRKRVFGLRNLHLYRKDFLQADFSKAEVLICYLHTVGMSEIAKKLMAERCFDGVLISNNFGLRDFQPERTVQINDFYKSPIYRYRLSWVGQ
jgi:hypothetical protein